MASASAFLDPYPTCAISANLAVSPHSAVSLTHSQYWEWDRDWNRCSDQGFERVAEGLRKDGQKCFVLRSVSRESVLRNPR